jgi:DNA-binding NarL/FixJ family response regulator
MAQRSPPRHRRALIVEDEFWIALGLEAEMHALGFEICDLAANAQNAFLRAMEDQPDVVLMDVCLEGGRSSWQGELTRRFSSHQSAQASDMVKPLPQWEARLKQPPL